MGKVSLTYCFSSSVHLTFLCFANWISDGFPVKGQQYLEIMPFHQGAQGCVWSPPPFYPHNNIAIHNCTNLSWPHLDISFLNGKVLDSSAFPHKEGASGLLLSRLPSCLLFQALQCHFGDMVIRTIHNRLRGGDYSRIIQRSSQLRGDLKLELPGHWHSYRHSTVVPSCLPSITLFFVILLENVHLQKQHNFAAPKQYIFACMFW